ARCARCCDVDQFGCRVYQRRGADTQQKVALVYPAQRLYPVFCWRIFAKPDHAWTNGTIAGLAARRRDFTVGMGCMRYALGVFVAGSASVASGMGKPAVQMQDLLAARTLLQVVHALGDD